MNARTGKLPIHEHPIYLSARIVFDTCKGCHGGGGVLYGGYFCNESDCTAWFHKECGEAPSEINHPFHQQHPPLLMTNDLGDRPCHLCGQKPLESVGYSCSTCDFTVDLICGIKPSPPVIEHPVCHNHPLVFLKKQEEEKSCELCKNSTGGLSYSCLSCDVYFHVDCVHLSEEVNHPCHFNHLLKLTPSESLSDEAEKTCLLCQKPLENILYYCSICNFTACLGCTKNPPPLSIHHTKTHKHELTLFPKAVAYVCLFSGMAMDNRAYICLPCGFVVSGHFINLPQVININRHDHRISFTHELRPGYLDCGVCRKLVDKSYGAYACVVCRNYAVHSQCALYQNVWDGVELEGTLEIIEDVSPFKVMGDNLICHFSHEKHTLRLHKDGIIHDEYTRCEACTYPIGFDPIYSCEECPFILHDKCANLPTKKRLVFDTSPFTLVVEKVRINDLLDCSLCGICSTGFMYASRRYEMLDVHCGSLSEPFVHDGHLHPLYFDAKEGRQCNACDKVMYHMLCCSGCDFDLCFSCGSLPKKIRHRNDEHPLILCCGEEVKETYWCDICETKLDPRKWFYTCFDCAVTLHVECVLGDFSRLMPGRIMDLGKNFDVVVNNHNTRPLCSICRSRCKVSVILKDCDVDDGYICSRSCFINMLNVD